MKKTRHTPNQIITKLRNVEAARAKCRTVADAVRDIGVAEQTYHRWKREYGTMDRDQLKRLKDLEKENKRLKKLARDLSLDKDILKEALEGNWRCDIANLSPARKRAAVRHVQKALDVSERRACQVVGQPRSTQRYEPKDSTRNRALTRRIRKLARRHPSYGYRRITAMLHREGQEVNAKRVYRLWRENRLSHRRKARKRRRIGSSANSCVRLKPTFPNHVWSYDFLFDATDDGRRLKWMTVIDEHTRECPALETRRSMTSTGVIDVLDRLIGERGAPAFIRSDNGTEFVANAVRDHLSELDVETRFIAPGAPWENGYI